ncbi:MAG: M24 family metallopeptidase [Candidatus Helarchaeota archaeon]
MELYKRDNIEKISPIGYSKENASKLMRKYDLDVLILNSPENVFYASGLPVLHQAKNPILYALRNQYPTIALIFRDGSQALILWDIFDKNLTWIDEIKGCLSPKDALRGLKRIIRKRKLSNAKIGVDDSMPFYQFQYLQENFPNIKFITADNLIIEMRLKKSTEEINRIIESTKITEKTIIEMIKSTKIGITDIELLKIGKLTMINEGAEGWDHFTMSIGESDPEAPGTGIKVMKNQIIRFDIGAMYKGYVSDLSRHVFIGKIPKNLDDTINTIVQVQNACQKSIKPGIDPQEVLKIAEKTWHDAGRTDSFIILIHSLGLRTEEFHFFDPMKGGNSITFQNGNVFDIEIWTLLKGFGTVGNEDTYLIKNNKCTRISTLEMKIYQK